MSPEVIQIVLPLTFLGICGLVGEILVQGHRDKVAEERLHAGFAERGASLRGKGPQEVGRRIRVLLSHHQPSSWPARYPKSTTPTAIEPKAAVSTAPLAISRASRICGCFLVGDRPRHGFQRGVEHLGGQHAGNAQQQDAPSHGIHPQHRGRQPAPPSQSTKCTTKLLPPRTPSRRPRNASANFCFQGRDIGEEIRNSNDEILNKS